MTNQSPQVGRSQHEPDVGRPTSPYRRDEALFLDERTAALVRLAALVADGAPAASYTDVVWSAITAHATPEELIGTLLTIAPIVGMSRTVAATPSLSLALGYDIDAAFEALAPLDDHPFRSPQE